MASAKFTRTIDISLRTGTDLLISGGIGQVINAFFDHPLIEIQTTQEFFPEFIKLVLQTVLTVVLGLEAKDFFYDQDFTDLTQGIAFDFLLMFQSNLLIRFKSVFKFISNRILTFISTVDTPPTENPVPQQ